jgi:hypothetical protein
MIPPHGEKDDTTSRFDNPGPGARDTVTDTPADRWGRSVRTVDEDANPPMSDPTKSDIHAGAGELPLRTPAARSRLTRPQGKRADPR